MKKTTDFLGKTAYIIAALILGWLAYSTTHYTFLHDINDFSSAYLFEAPDSRIKNLAVVVVSLLFFFSFPKLLFFNAKTKENKDRRVLFFSIFAALGFLTLSCRWVFITYIEPFWDQAFVLQAAMDFKDGNYAMMGGAYLKMYPQQLGLIFFESLLLRIWNFYGFLQYLNCVFVAVSIFVAGRISHELFDTSEADLIVVFLMTFCAPLLYYVTFVYGDIFAFSSCLLITYLTIKLVKTNRWHYALLMVICGMITLPIRENSLIFFLALAISLIVLALRNKRFLLILLAVLMIVAPYCSNRAIKMYYQAKSGIVLDNEIPSINWIVMGMGGNLEEGKGVGFYDGYNYYSWLMQGENKKAAAEYSKTVMADYFKEYKENPLHAVKFYRYKIFEQWLEPTFDCVYMTVSDHEEAWKDGEVLYYHDFVANLNRYMNYYLTVIYLFAFVYTVLAVFKDKDFHGLVMPVYFVGVFLFSIIWEAKGRYTLPGFLFLIIPAAMGITQTVNLLLKLITKKEQK